MNQNFFAKRSDFFLTQSGEVELVSSIICDVWISVSLVYYFRASFSDGMKRHVYFNLLRLLVSKFSAIQDEDSSAEAHIFVHQLRHTSVVNFQDLHNK